MNLSRSNNVVNLCATQSYAWIVEVIGRDAANVYISAFGVQFWLQQTDPETRRRAAEICGLVTREKVSGEHNFDLPGVCAALGSGRDLVMRHRVRDEEGERYRAEDFAHLDVGDIIAYNKGRAGRFGKVTKGRASYHFCTRKPQGAAAVTDRVREYTGIAGKSHPCPRGVRPVGIARRHPGLFGSRGALRNGRRLSR